MTAFIDTVIAVTVLCVYKPLCLCGMRRFTQLHSRPGHRRASNKRHTGNYTPTNTKEPHKLLSQPKP